MSVDSTATDAWGAVAVLAKTPQIGQVKTRMCVSQDLHDQALVLSSSQALRLHLWCLDELTHVVIPELLSLGVVKVARLFMSSEISLNTLYELGSIQEEYRKPQDETRGVGHDWTHALTQTFGALRVQSSGGLGSRMLAALNESFDAADTPPLPRDAVIILGTDSPQLDPAQLSSGVARLQATSAPRVLIGPAEDGGYYTIGCNRAAHAQIQTLFSDDIEWGTSTVRAETLRRAHNVGLEVIELAASFDLDRPADLERLRALGGPRVARLERALAPHPLASPPERIIADQYTEALAWLFGLTRFGERLDLSAPRAINHALGAPLACYRNILIGGTNGKGSTTAALMALAQTCGVSAGSFTSPHLVSFRERIRVGDTLISPAEVVAGVRVISETARRASITLSFFEATWALAAWCFRARGVEWVIWEVGLGGRLDATNTCEPEVSAVVSLALDHTHILGDTLEAIAAEKAPIFRGDRPALTAASGEALRALRAVSPPQLQALEEIMSPDQIAALSSPDPHGAHPSMRDTSHGRTNLALAWLIARAAGWSPPIWPDLPRLDLSDKLEGSPDPVDAWWRHVHWPGRLERLAGVWLDCAHNPASAERLAEWLSSTHLEGARAPRHLIIGMSADKDQRATLTRLLAESEHVTLVSPRYPRCVNADTLWPICERALMSLDPKIRPEVTITHALSDALSARDPRALTLVTGSCFLVGEARAWILGVPFPESGISTIAR